MGVENDANNTMLFQKIKHNRQMSGNCFFVVVISEHLSLHDFSACVEKLRSIEALLLFVHSLA